MKYIFGFSNCWMCIILLAGCVGNIAPKCDSPTATLAQTWQLEQLTFNDSVVGVDSVYQEHILANGQYFVDTPLTSDANNSPEIKRRDGYWEFSADQTQIVFDKGTIAEVVAEIVTLECKQLVLTYEVVHPVWGAGVLRFTMNQVP